MVIASKAVAIKALVVTMVWVVSRPMVRPMSWMPMSSRCPQLIPLREINQANWVIMSIGLNQKSEFRN